MRNRVIESCGWSKMNFLLELADKMNSQFIKFVLNYLVERI